MHALSSRIKYQISMFENECKRGSQKNEQQTSILKIKKKSTECDRWAQQRECMRKKNKSNDDRKW